MKFARELLQDPERNDPVWEELMATFGRVVTGLRESACVSIAAIEGPAVGAGISLALATDLVVMSERAVLKPMWLDMGAIPDGGSSYLIARRIGSQGMFRLALGGHAVTANHALEYGLVDEVAPAGEAEQRAMALAAELAPRSGAALLALRRLADAFTTVSLAEQLQSETDELRTLRRSKARRSALSM